MRASMSAGQVAVWILALIGGASAHGQTTVSYTGPGVAITDSTPAGVDVTLPVAGLSGTIADLNFRFDTGGACDATVGNTNAAVDHTYIGDLSFRLTSPSGTSVVFLARRGGTRENICLVNLDDEGGFPNVSTLTEFTGSPMAGDFSPEFDGMFSAFDGEGPNGNWVLNVSDNAGGDTGSVRRFSLIIGTTACGRPIASDNLLFANGGLDTGTSSSSGVVAPAVDCRWSELQNDTGNTTESNVSAGYTITAGTFRLADDFTVAGPSLTLGGVALYAYQTGAPASPSPFAGATLRVWDGRPGDVGANILCGDTTTNRLTRSIDTPFLRLFNSSVPPPGNAPGTTRKIWRNVLSMPSPCNGANFFQSGNTYWMDWDITATNAGTMFYPAITIPGARTRPNANARQFNVGTGVWADVIDAGNPGTAPDVFQDLMFDLLSDTLFKHGFE